MIDRRVSAFLHGLARSQTGVHGGRPPAALIMFCCGTAWYMCVIAWLQRRFGLLADLPGRAHQCGRRVERAESTTAHQVLSSVRSPGSGLTLINFLLLPYKH
jgi:hypothetical protein